MEGDITESQIDDIKPLVDTPYSYENIKEDPVLQIISETDRAYRYLEEVAYKKVTEASVLTEEINAQIGSIPEYKDTQIIHSFIDLKSMMSDAFRIRDLQIRELIECIRRSHQMRKELYARIISEKDEEYDKIDTIIPQGSYIAYLDKLAKNQDTKVFAEAIIVAYNESQETDEKRKFNEACRKVYAAHLEKADRQLLSRINRMEI